MKLFLVWLILLFFSQDQSESVVKPENEGQEPSNDMEVVEEDEEIQIEDVKEVKSKLNESQTQPDENVAGDGDGDAQTNDAKMMVKNLDLYSFSIGIIFRPREI